MITLSRVRSWDTTHLHAAAMRWNSVAADWEQFFDAVHNESFAPGGTDWAGEGATDSLSQKTSVTDPRS